MGLDLLLQRVRNDPYKESRHPRYSPLEKWPDRKIREVGEAQWNALSRRAAETPAPAAASR